MGAYQNIKYTSEVIILCFCVYYSVCWLVKCQIWRTICVGLYIKIPLFSFYNTLNIFNQVRSLYIYLFSHMWFGVTSKPSPSYKIVLDHASKRAEQWEACVWMSLGKNSVFPKKICALICSSPPHLPAPDLTTWVKELWVEANSPLLLYIVLYLLCHEHLLKYSVSLGNVPYYSSWLCSVWLH